MAALGSADRRISHRTRRLLNHDHQWFCHQSNVSSGASKILHSLPVDPSRPVILLSERSFPTLGFVAQAASTAGYQVRMLPADIDTTDPARWADAIGSDVGVVMIGHAESNTGTQLPVADIVEITRAAGAISMVDVAQSAGLLPIDLRAWQVDFVVGTSVKWLCGGPGAGFLWVNPDIIDRCRPLDVGWFSHEDPFEFNIDDFRFAPDARRFWGGTPSPIPAAIARHSIFALNEIGLAAIAEHNETLTQRLIDGIDDRMLVSPRQPEHRSGTVVVEPDQSRRTVLLGDLAAARIHVDERSTGIRISPHVHNTTADIDTTLSVLTQSRSPR